MNKFYFEITDTYGGEANYSWVHRYDITAKSLKGAFLIDDEYRIDNYEFKKI